MHIPTRLTTKAVAVATVGCLLGLAAIVGVTQAAWFSPSNSGRPEPTGLSPQSSSSTSGGLRLALTGAQFTGLDTYVRLEVAAPDSSLDLSSVRSLSVLRDDATGGLAPRGDGVSGPVTNGAIPVIMPFAPVTPGESETLRISALMVSLTDGSARRVEGSWELQLTPPANIRELLKTESLVPKETRTTISGISVSLERAVRTSADLRVTVSFGGAFADDVLTPPLLRSGGHEYVGTLLPGAESNVATWAFPPEEFGSTATVEFRSMLMRNSANPVAGSTIDGHGVLTDLGHPPSVGDTAAIGSARIFGSNGPAPSLIRWTSGSNQASTVLELVIPMASDPQQLVPPDLMLPSGKTALPLGRIVGFNRDSSGTIIGGSTTYRYGIDSPSDVDGTLLLKPGPGVSVANGAWKFDLTPVSP